MLNRSMLHRRLGFLVIPAMCIAVLTYIGYHAFTGERGIYAHERLEAEMMTLEAQLADLTEERVLLEKQIALLRPDTLDPDMLDERVRAVLNFEKEDEITILRSSR